MEAGVLQRMREVEQAVLELDESVRASAFSMMGGYILGEQTVSRRSASAGPDANEDVESTEGVGLGDFFAGRDTDKPAEAVMAIAAYLFQQFGSEPFTLQEVRDIADEVGLTIPERIDMTLKGATRNGRPIFRSVGRGKYAPTVLGEATLKQDHNVTKGRRKKALAQGEEG